MPQRRIFHKKNNNLYKGIEPIQVVQTYGNHACEPYVDLSFSSPHKAIFFYKSNFKNPLKNPTSYLLQAGI